MVDLIFSQYRMTARFPVPVDPRGGQRLAAYVNGQVQKAQRRAAIGTSLRHSGHFLVVGSGATSPRRIRARIVFIGSTMKKYTAAAIKMNETSALIKSPIGNLVPLTVNSIAEKSGFPTMAAINGVIRSFTSAVTTAPNATPITTATARSRTLPRRINCLKPCNIFPPEPTVGLVRRLK